MAITEKLTTVPNEPGVYLLKDAEGKPIYVGKAQSLRKRLQQHFQGADRAGAWHVVMISHVADLDYILTSSPREALLLESTLIKQHKPRYNIRLMDDKSYPYVMLTDEAFPRLVVLRDLPPNARPGGQGKRVARALHDPKRHEVHRLGQGEVFGPYAEARPMRQAMRLVGQLFGLRSCRKALTGAPQGVPCLNYHMKRCLGPCRGDITGAQYAEAVRQTRRFLSGHTGRVLSDFRRKMTAAAARQEFERAAVWRDTVQALEKATRHEVVIGTRSVEQDVAAVAAAEDLAVVAVLRVRHGRLLGAEDYLLRAVSGHSPAEMLEAFLTQHYSAAQWAPREVLLPVEIEGREEWEQTLRDLRGARVTVRVPRRGPARGMLELAQRNAEQALVRAQAMQTRREGMAASVLEDLRELVGMEQLPERIEGYDISNIQGDHATAAMVVFTRGQPDRQSYRRFRMRTVGPDDFAMMAEALRRRLQRAAAGDPSFLPLPDLIMVDGGAGQVSAAQRVLEEMGEAGIALVGLAKREEQVRAPGQANPLPAEEHEAGRYLLQRVRDETHRFAVTYHRGLRAAAMTRSVLDDVPGLGPRRRTALLRAFGSVRAMAEASAEELAAAPGMNRRVAAALLERLAEKAPTPPAADRGHPSRGGRG
ncbi:MAG TPA: excinuclease ABC subunit UvrC [Armatimonadota bacterium]|jgi:excinuclease ABC subunit C